MKERVGAAFQFAGIERFWGNDDSCFLIETYDEDSDYEEHCEDNGVDMPIIQSHGNFLRERPFRVKYVRNVSSILSCEPFGPL